MEARTYISTLEETELVECVARIVSSVREEKPNYTGLAAELAQAIPFDVFGLVRLMHDKTALRIIECHREVGIWQASYRQRPLEDSRFAEILRDPVLTIANHPAGLTGEPALNGDALSASHHLNATLIAPLVVANHVLGTFELGSTRLDIYNDRDLQRLVDAVGRALASAIESAIHDGKTAIHDRQLLAIQTVSSALASRMDLPGILNQLVAGIADSLKAAALIILIDPREHMTLRLAAQSGLDEQAVQQAFQQLPLSDRCIFGQTLLGQKPLSTQDIDTDDRYPASHMLFTGLGLHSLLCHPLIAGSTIYGVLGLASPEPGGFTPLKADILALFASQAGIAIHNGFLLEAAHQRTRFQQAIKHLEEEHDGPSGQLAATEEDNKTVQESELELLMNVREQVQHTFGISLSSMLRFVSDYLLTEDERNLQGLSLPNQETGTREANSPDNSNSQFEPGSQEMVSSSVREESSSEPLLQPIDAVSYLTNMTEAALVRTDFLGDLSRLLIQFKQSDSGLKHAWFVTDLRGNCVFMNPGAEALCETRIEENALTYRNRLLTPIKKSNAAIPITKVFAKLLPRIRNAGEVSLYLKDFAQSSIYRQELRCSISAESLLSLPELQQEYTRDQAGDGAPSDRHYQCIRYPLCNQDGTLVANALQVCDITEEVRDEKNRSALLSSVSHDLRTPLTAIKAAVTGLLQSEMSWTEQDRQEVLEDVDVEVDHLTVLVGALVELSRIEMGALVLTKEWCDIGEIVYGALAQVKRIPVRKRFQSGLPLIYVDHVQIERVFCNLLENAVKRSPAQAEILIEVEAVGTEIRVRVIDRGNDIPAADRELLFQSFRNLRSYGNGLGLAMCKGIVEAHQGSIWVEAVAGGGASFIFTLPVHAYSGGHVVGEALSAPSWMQHRVITSNSQPVQELVREDRR